MPDTPADPAAARLAEIRERWLPYLGTPYVPPGSKGDAEALLAALEAALKFHRQVAPQFRGKGCIICGGIWPCVQYKAISAALLGEEAP